MACYSGLGSSKYGWFQVPNIYTLINTVSTQMIGRAYAEWFSSACFFFNQRKLTSRMGNSATGNQKHVFEQVCGGNIRGSTTGETPESYTLHDLIMREVNDQHIISVR